MNGGQMDGDNEDDELTGANRGDSENSKQNKTDEMN